MASTIPSAHISQSLVGMQSFPYFILESHVIYNSSLFKNEYMTHSQKTLLIHKKHIQTKVFCNNNDVSDCCRQPSGMDGVLTKNGIARFCMTISFQSTTNTSSVFSSSTNHWRECFTKCKHSPFITYIITLENLLVRIIWKAISLFSSFWSIACMLACLAGAHE